MKNDPYIRWFVFVMMLFALFFFANIYSGCYIDTEPCNRICWNDCDTYCDSAGCWEECERDCICCEYDYACYDVCDQMYCDRYGCYDTCRTHCYCR